MLHKDAVNGKERIGVLEDVSSLLVRGKRSPHHLHLSVFCLSYDWCDIAFSHKAQGKQTT